MKFSKTILITGGAGFIGSHLVLHMVEHYPNYQIINLDTLTYASDISYLSKISEESNYLFVKGDINDRVLLQELFQKHRINNVIHLAAESHVDNSILYPSEFAKTNVMGTIQLLDIAHKAWQGSTTGFRFIIFLLTKFLEATRKRNVFRKHPIPSSLPIFSFKGKF